MQSRPEVSAAQYEAAPERAPANGRRHHPPPDSSHAAAVVSSQSCTSCAATHASAAMAQVLREEELKEVKHRLLREHAWRRC